ncbi:MAG: PilZ domain-containing protein [Phycisphaerae bacterium]
MTRVATQQPTVADAIENTLEWLDQHSGSGKQSERRANRRNRYRVQARICYLPAGSRREAEFSVMTRNLSRTGLSFLHKTLIYPRQLVQVHLPLPDHSTTNFLAKVVRVRLAGPSLYEIGVEFTAMEVNLA